jgi:hypothetical protein
MRYNEFKHQIQEQDDLLEIRMDPTSLAAAVKNIDAKVGMEFEMIVPNVGDDNSSYDDVEYEPDYENDPAPRNISDILDFFFDGDYNGRRDISNLERELRDDFSDWASEAFDSRWESDKETFVYDYIRDNMTGEDVAEILGLDPDSIDAISRAQAEQAADIIIQAGGYRLNNIREHEEQMFMDDSDLEEQWLEEVGITAMSDVSNSFSISWPHYTEVNTGRGSDSGASIDEVAEAFSAAVGKPVNASKSYHGARRESGKYVVEPDGSLNPDDGNDMGLEFVSPPMSVSEMISDLEKVRKWAESVGAYTNKSTGLHMNVSIPDYNDDKLDYVKLALLLGDKYVLDQFGRSANTYTASALGKIQDRAKNLSPDQVQGLFDQMRAGLNTLASRSIHGAGASKYTSIHPKGNYVEFRSPGGDWLSEDPKTLVSTMMRFIVALDAAVDPQKYRKEYLSKLRKLLAPKSEDDPISYFVKYSSGELPKQALKSFIRNAQFQRKAKKGTTEKMWWRVGLKSNPNYSIEVVGRTRDEAVDNAMRANGELMSYNFENDFTAYPLRPFADDSTQSRQGSIRYEIFNVQRNEVIDSFNASSDEAALQRFDSMFSGANRNLYDVRRARDQSQPQTPTLIAPETQPDANFAFVDRINNQVVQWLTRNTREEAERELQGTGLAHLYNVVEVRPRTSSTPIPGSTQDLQQRRSQGYFTGSWKILIDGEEVHRFGGVGNVQADATRYATRWLLAQQREGSLNISDSAEIEVLPIMGN